MGVSELIILSIVLTMLLGCSIGLLINNRSKYRQNILEMSIKYDNELSALNIKNYLLQEDIFALNLENSNLRGLNDALSRRIKELEERI